MNDYFDAYFRAGFYNKFCEIQRDSSGAEIHIINLDDVEELWIHDITQCTVEIGKCPKLKRILLEDAKMLDLVKLNEYKGELKLRALRINIIGEKSYPQITDIDCINTYGPITIDLDLLPRLTHLNLPLYQNKIRIINSRYIETITINTTRSCKCEDFGPSHNVIPDWYYEICGKELLIDLHYHAFSKKHVKEIIRMLNLSDNYRFEKILINIYSSFSDRNTVSRLTMDLFDAMKYTPKKDLFIYLYPDGESKYYNYVCFVNKEMEKLGYTLPPSRTTKSARK